METKQAKFAKSSALTDSICVTRIYEHVKSRKFLEQLCLECMEGIKEKPAYMNMKAMIDKLLSKTMKFRGRCPSNEAERLNTMRMQVAECGMLAYTIDCIVAEMVCNKLELEYYSMVKNIVKELSEEKKLEGDSDIHDNVQKEASTSIPKISLGKKDECINTKPEGATSNVHINNGSVNNIACKDKNALSEVSKTSAKLIQRTKRETGTDKAKSSEAKAKSQDLADKSFSKIVVKPDHQDVINDKAKGLNVDNMKDAESNKRSEIDSCSALESDQESCWSMGSVSPVHTSDLSSFDDLISLSSGDEVPGSEKKKIRLKDANEIFLDGKLSEIYHMEKRVMPHNTKRRQTSKKNSSTELFSSSDEESTPRKSLPQRKRKPNSKYASGIYNCNLKNSSNPTAKEVSASNLRTEAEKQDAYSCIAAEVKFLSKEPKAYLNSPPTERPSTRNNGTKCPNVYSKKVRDTKVLSSTEISCVKKDDENDLKKLTSEEIMKKRGRPKKTLPGTSTPEIFQSSMIRKPNEAFPSYRLEDSNSQTSSNAPSKKMKVDQTNNELKEIESSPSKEKSTKRYDSTDLYKPRPLIPSFGNRGSRAVTLCSTP